MSTPRKAAAREPARLPFAPLDFISDLARQQMCVVNEANCAMARGLEAMRDIGQQVARDTTARHEAAAKQLQGGCAPLDIASAQATLLQQDLQDAGRYWRDMMGAALEMQVEMMGCTSHLLDSEAAIESVSALEAFDALPGMAAMFGRGQRQARVS